MHHHKISKPPKSHNVEAFYRNWCKSEKAMATHSSTLAWKIPWTEEPGRLPSMGSRRVGRLSDFTFTFQFHALEKEMAIHSSVLAWRIPGMGEPGGLQSMGLHRVGHDWSNLAAAARSVPALLQHNELHPHLRSYVSLIVLVTGFYYKKLCLHPQWFGCCLKARTSLLILFPLLAQLWA